MITPTSPSTEHVDKSLEGVTDTTTGEATKVTDPQTTLPDHGNIHAGTMDSNTVPDRRTTPTDGKDITIMFS